MIDRYKNIKNEGEVTDRELFESYRRFEVYALPSLAENFVCFFEVEANIIELVLKNEGSCYSD